jgi:hypothetical protein
MLVLLLAITIHTGFEAGSLGKVEKVADTHFRCAVKGESDQDGRNRQPSWFYFRMDGVRNREITVDLTDLAGEYNYRKHNGAGLRNMHPVYSYDNKSWKNFGKVEWIEKASTIRIRFKAEQDSVWIARIAPYTTRHLRKLLDGLRGNPGLRKDVVGKTVEGRPMLLLTVTNPKLADSRKKVIWLMARQHSWETGTSWVAEGALRFLLSPDPRARQIRDECIFKIFPMADPDGVARGGVRFNANGYDLNRNWDAVDSKLMPEIYAQRKAVLDWVDSGGRIDLFLALHNTESADFIQGPLSAGGPHILQLGQRFWKLLDTTTSFYSPKGPEDSPVTTTSGMKGRMAVYQGLYHDRKIPAFLMEQMVDFSPKLSRWPAVEDRIEFGGALARAMCAAVSGS